MPDHISQFRHEIRRNGVHYVPVQSEEYFVGNRLHWRTTYRSADGDTIIREYSTPRIRKNGKIVFEWDMD